MEMTSQRWQRTNEYLRNAFGAQDDHLAGLMADAVDRGLPDIAITADVGRLLMILTSLTPGRLAIEVGTLGGYSGIWIARGLSREGRLITVEREDLHADFAREQFDRAGVGDRVEIRRGPALEVLTRLAGELVPGSVDVVFVDAEKEEYPAYWEILKPLIAPGGLIMADNALGAGSWWIDDEGGGERNAADRFNRLVAGDDDFEAVAVPIRQGILIGRRMR
ncbi:MAG: O-methyltransferase [Phycisphaerales bacterium]|nr:MAG: O-methyltransferase [Phycisphaerales bacterium]